MDVSEFEKFIGALLIREQGMNNGEIAEELNLPESVPHEERKKIHKVMGSPHDTSSSLA